MAQDKDPPAGMPPRLVKQLLDNLETNDAFRAAFSASPERALRSLGYTDSTDCMQLRAGAKLASPEEIKAQRGKLEASLGAIHGMICPLEAQGD